MLINGMPYLKLMEIGREQEGIVYIVKEQPAHPYLEHKTMYYPLLIPHLSHPQADLEYSKNYHPTLSSYTSFWVIDR